MEEETTNAIKRIDDCVNKIFKMLNGKDGLVTETALNKQSIKRIWWAYGIVIVLLSGIVGKILYFGIP